jgi:SIR2-like domain
MSTLVPENLFLFVGAGVSLSAPAGLPMFDWLRDEILGQLGLDAYRQGSPHVDPARAAVAAGLAPEPFMFDLRQGGVALQPWLEDILDGRPNAAHHALATLAGAGARVWTVNFDRLIERARPGLRVLAWPATPDSSADLVKPHGTLGGELIVGADQVLRGLAPAWAERLRADVRGRTVVFVGYSGRDLDFQPQWDTVLSDAIRVLWFDQPDPAAPDRVVDEDRRRLLLRETDRRGALEFCVAGPAPQTAAAPARPNSAADFVRWCQDEGLARFDPDLMMEMYAPVHVDYPPLTGELAWARASVLGHLGDAAASRRQRQRLLRDRRTRRRAVRELLLSSVTNGDHVGRVILRGTWVLPPVGRLAAIREGAERKRLTALHREAQHGKVLRATEHLDGSAVSTLLILRACALRMMGSLDEAAALADEALRRARAEEHAVRTAHAAFQKALALLWAERVEEAHRCLEDELQPFAGLAANRWVAWSHFLAGGLAVRRHDPVEALQALELSQALFAAEALMDGVISVRLARLTALRLARDDDAFREQYRALDKRSADDGGLDWRWYAQRSGITELALHLEEAEFLRTVGADPTTARRHYRAAAGGPYPLYAALGLLGLALCTSADSERRRLALQAQDAGAGIGAQLVSARAAELLAGTADAERPIFFC